MPKTAFISTAIPYVNARPHIGFALELVQADAMARYLRLTGFDTFFLTGTDENSLKNVRAAQAAGISTAELCRQNSAAFEALLPALNISANRFLRTSADADHVAGARRFWSKTRPADLYKKHYSGLYCVGCEDFYAEKDVPGGVCPEHGTKLETVEEENWFFRLSAWETEIRGLLESGRLRIVPEFRRNEMLAFLRAGLQDFSVSRGRQRAGDWGISVPGDEAQVMYVWYDALTNYVTGLDYEHEGALYQRYWVNAARRIHMIGKGINRFHTLYWPGMLLSAGVPLPDTVFVHGYLTINGQKISKSLGNVVDPAEQVARFGADAVRHYLLRAVSPFDDGDWSEARFREIYNADLANNLGNLVRRVQTIGEKAAWTPPAAAAPEAPEGFHEAMEGFRFHDAAGLLWARATRLNQRCEELKPWEMQKQGRDGEVRAFLDEMAAGLRATAHWLQPFLPATSETILAALAPGAPLRRGGPLFPRLP